MRPYASPEKPLSGRFVAVGRMTGGDNRVVVYVVLAEIIGTTRT